MGLGIYLLSKRVSHSSPSWHQVIRFASGNSRPSSQRATPRRYSPRPQPQPAFTRKPALSPPTSRSHSHSPSTSATRPQDNDSYQLAGKVKQLTANEDFAAATTLVKSARETNIVVYNVLLHELLRAAKFRAAFELWTDLKRRGLTPTQRSFSTFFAGCSKIHKEDTAAFARVKTVFAQWLVYAEKREAAADRQQGGRQEMEEDVDEDILSSVPTNAYLTFLSKTNRFDELIETFSAMPTSGPLAPTLLSYSIVLGAAHTIVALPTPPSSSLETPLPVNRFPTVLSIFTRLRAEPFVPDTSLTTLMISVCRSSPSLDSQAIGLALSEEYFGLILDPLREHELVSSKTLPEPKVQMDGTAFSNVLALALKLNKSTLAVRLFDQVRDYPERFGRDIIEHWHCDLVLVALGMKHNSAAAEDLINWMLRSSKIRPRVTTWTNAFQACWRTGDLARAFTFYTLMTGKSVPLLGSPLSAKDDTTPSPPIDSKRTFFDLDERISTTLLQTALATKDRSKIHQTLSLIEQSTPFGPEFFPSLSDSTFPSPTSTSSKLRSSSSSRSTATFTPHWRYRLSEAVEQSVSMLLESKDVSDNMSREQISTMKAWSVGAGRWREGQVDGQVGGLESMKMRREIVRKEKSGRGGEKERTFRRDGSSSQSFSSSGSDYGVEEASTKLEGHSNFGTLGRGGRPSFQDGDRGSRDRSDTPQRRSWNSDRDQGEPRRWGSDTGPRDSPPTRSSFSGGDRKDGETIQRPRWNSDNRSGRDKPWERDSRDKPWERDSRDVRSERRSSFSGVEEVQRPRGNFGSADEREPTSGANRYDEGRDSSVRRSSFSGGGERRDASEPQRPRWNSTGDGRRESEGERPQRRSYGDEMPRPRWNSDTPRKPWQDDSIAGRFDGRRRS